MGTEMGKVSSRVIRAVTSLRPAKALAASGLDRSELARTGVFVLSIACWLGLTGAASASQATRNSSGSGPGTQQAKAASQGQVAAPGVATRKGKAEITQEEAVRFLVQASFGPTRASIAHLRAIGYEAWIDEQLQEPISVQAPWISALPPVAFAHSQERRLEIWWRNAIQGPDQLRQRMAFALSQILVISDRDPKLEHTGLGLARYYDKLAVGALGNYRGLLGRVTLDPFMGLYLSHWQNEQADLSLGIRPDENFAREVMQLFTIGLHQLALDGTVLRDSQNAPLPTYDQKIVKELARVFTGWNFNAATNWEFPEPSFGQMTNWSEYHDFGSKTIVNGTVIPSGLSAALDVEKALDILFEHPNVAPFLSRQLIMRFVTSNPSPAYIARVARIFEDDGTGERGDLLQVVRAILLDEEARRGPTVDDPSFGKLKEPLLRQAQLWRMFQVTFPAQLENPGLLADYRQAPLQAPLVFNFFSPFYQPPGDLAQAGLVAPEFQISEHSAVASTTNRWFDLVFEGYSGAPSAPDWQGLIDIEAEKALASDAGALVHHLDALMMAGQMSTGMRAIVIDLVEDTPLGDGTDRVLEALYIIGTSPEFAVQR